MHLLIVNSGNFVKKTQIGKEMYFCSNILFTFASI
jgi:hypothetical protein